MDRVVKYLNLQGMSVFSDLTSEDLWRWSEQMQVRTCKPGAIVLQSGRPVDGLWLLQSGSVLVNESKLDLSPFKAFARMVQHEIAKDDWRAGPENGCSLFIIPRAEAIAILYENPRILRELMTLADFPSWITR